MAEQGVVKLPAAVPGLKQDALGQVLLAASVLLTLSLFLWLYMSFDRLPDLLPLHFDAQGNADRIEEREVIYLLPLIGLAVNLVNITIGLLLRSRLGLYFAAYLLWGGALTVQVLIWVAAINIVR